MKQQYSLLFLIVVMVISACQSSAVPVETAPSQIPDTATPSVTPSPMATETTTPNLIPTLDLPVSVNTPFQIEPIAISKDNLTQLRELLKHDTINAQFFDSVELNDHFILDTNHGVLITNKNGEIQKVLPPTETYCRSNIFNVSKDLIVSDDGKIGIIGYDQIQVYSADGESLLYSLSLKKDFIARAEELTFWDGYCPKNHYIVRLTSNMKVAAIGYNSADIITDIYDISTQAFLVSLKDVAWPRMFSPDDKYLVVEKPNKRVGQIAIYQTTDWTEVANIGNNETIGEVGFSPDGKYLFAKTFGTDPTYIYVFNLENRTQIKISSIPNSPILFSTDNKMILAGQFDETTYTFEKWNVWDLGDNKQIDVIDSYSKEIWKESISEFNDQDSYPSMFLDKFKIGSITFFTANADIFSYISTIKNTDSYKDFAEAICTLNIEGLLGCENNTFDTRKFIKPSDGIYALEHIESSWELQKYSDGAKTSLMALNDIPAHGFYDWVSPIDWFELTPDEKYLIYVTQMDNISARRIETDEIVLKKSAKYLKSFFVNPHRNRYVAFLASMDCSPTVWDLEGGLPIFTFTKDCQSVAPVVSFASGQEFVYVRLNPSPVEKWKTIGTVHFYNYEKGEETRSFDVELVHQNIFSMAFSPDGKILALGLTDGMILLLDAETGQVLHSWRGHNGEVDSISFSNDGTKILTFGGLDYYAKIWGVLP
jgi:WD40 repeat protein